LLAVDQLLNQRIHVGLRGLNGLGSGYVKFLQERSKAGLLRSSVRLSVEELEEGVGLGKGSESSLVGRGGADVSNGFSGLPLSKKGSQRWLGRFLKTLIISAYSDEHSS